MKLKFVSSWKTHLRVFSFWASSMQNILIFSLRMHECEISCKFNWSLVGDSRRQTTSRILSSGWRDHTHKRIAKNVYNPTRSISIVLCSSTMRFPFRLVPENSWLAFMVECVVVQRRARCKSQRRSKTSRLIRIAFIYVIIIYHRCCVVFVSHDQISTASTWMIKSIGRHRCRHHHCCVNILPTFLTTQILHSMWK